VFELQYVAALLADDFWTFDQTFYGSDFAPRSRVYVGGYVLVDYLLRTYGMDAVLALSRECLRYPIRGIRRAIRVTLGTDADTLYAELLADLRTRYGSRADHPGGRRLSPDDGGYWFLVRGTTELYGGPPDRYAGLTGPAGIPDEAATPGLRNTNAISTDPFSISASGSLILFTRPASETFRPDPTVGYTDLYVTDRHTGASRRVTEGRRLYHVSGSGDATFAVAAERDGAFSRLVVIDLENGDVRSLWKPDDTWIAFPSVSPDGMRVAVAASTSGQQDLFQIDVRDGTAERLTNSRDLAEMFPVYVSDTAIWFSAAADGPLALYELDLSSGEVFHVLTDRDGVFHGVPDEGGVIFQSYTETGPTVKAVDSVARTPVAWPTASPGPPVGETVSSIVDLQGGTRVYRDWPAPELWIPLVLPVSAGRSAGELSFEAGGLVVAAGPLERNTATLIATVHTLTGVPTVSAGLLHSRGAGAVRFDAVSGPRYLDETGLRSLQQSRISVALARNLFSVSGARTRQTMTASLALSGHFASPEGVLVTDHWSEMPESRIGGSAGLSWSLSLPVRVADLLGPAGLFVSMAGSYLSSVDGLAGPGSGAGATGAASLRLPVGGGILAVQFSAATPAAAAEIDAIRGTEVAAYGTTAQRGSPAVVLRAGFDSPSLLLDRGLRNVFLTRAGLTGYVQQTVDYADPGLGLRPETTVAVEAIVGGGYMSATLLPAIGVAITVPHSPARLPRVGITFRAASTDTGFIVGR
jgi:hypothetical protein